MRPWALLLALAACADPPAAPVSAVTAVAPVATVTRHDGTWTGTAIRSFGRDFECGPASRAMRMDVVQGRATGTLPQHGEGAGTVAPDGALTLRSRLDATARAEGRFADRGYSARMVTRSCAWTITMNRAGLIPTP